MPSLKRVNPGNSQETNQSHRSCVDEKRCTRLTAAPSPL